MQTYTSNLAQYQQETTAPWTRIDMLLDIYDKTMTTIKSLLSAYADRDNVAVAQMQIKSLSLIALIESGVDLEWEGGNNISRLCQFISQSIVDGEIDAIHTGYNVLKTIRDGFWQIRSKAIELESAGEIPSLEIKSSVELEV